MKFISLHSKNTSIQYKNALCSYATIVVLAFIVSSVMIPVVLVSLLSPYSGISSSKNLYEQPKTQFKYKHIFTAETKDVVDSTESGLVACSTFSNFNSRFKDFSKSCASVKYWSTDLDHDTTSDIAHFELLLDTLPGAIKSFDLIVFFEAQLKQKCNLVPPALLTQHLLLPSTALMSAGTIHMKAELQLKQYIEFRCPFPGRNIKTNFRDIVLNENLTAVDISQYEMESLLEQLKANPGYFQLNVENTYFKRDISKGLRIRLDVDILQVPVRYHLSVWERLGQFWLYFASFFGISFYIMDKIKDFLFGRHIIRSWEVIPWKKLY